MFSLSLTSFEWQLGRAYALLNFSSVHLHVKPNVKREIHVKHNPSRITGGEIKDAEGRNGYSSGDTKDSGG